MRRQYYTERRSPLVAAACVLMLASFCARLICFWDSFGTLDGYTLTVHALLPLSCSLLFPVLLFFCGRRALWTTAIPVVLGVVFFALKAQTFSRLHMALCLLLYLAVAALYTCTVTGLIPTQRLLIPLFGLPLLYHLFVEDLHTLRFAQPPLTLREWLPELSVLLIMAALLCVSLAMKRRKR